MRLSLEAWGKASGGRIPRGLLEEELTNPSADPQSRAGLLMAEAIRQIHVQDMEGAVTTLEQAHRLVDQAHLRSEYVAPVPAWLTTALRLRLAQVSALAPKRREELLKEAEQVARRAQGIARIYRNNLPHVLRERGLLAAMAGHPRRARKWLQQSLSLAEQLKMRHEHAQTLLARGQVGMELGWPEAEEDLRLATRELQELEQGLSEESLSPGALPERPETLSLVDRFPRVLEAGRRIASALTREAVFEAVRQSMLELLRAEHCVVLDPAAVLSEETRSAEGVSRAAIAEALGTGRPAIMGQGTPAA